MGFLLLWAGASVAAILVAWQGVSVVDRQVIHPPSADSTIRSSDDFPRTVAQGAAGDLDEADASADAADARTDAQSNGTAGPSAAPTGDRFELDLSTATFPDQQGEAGFEDGASPPARTTTPRTNRTPTPTPRLSLPLPTVLPATPRSAPNATPTPRVVNTPRPGTTPRATASPVPTSPGVPPPTPTTSAPKPTSTLRPTPTAAPVPTPSPSATSAPTPSPTPAPAAQVLTFDLIGGTTAISFSSAAVVVQFASAAPGFSVDVSNSGPGVRVEFTSESGQSRIDAWWGDGPEWEVSEDHD